MMMMMMMMMMMYIGMYLNDPQCTSIISLPSERLDSLTIAGAFETTNLGHGGGGAGPATKVSMGQYGVDWNLGRWCHTVDGRNPAPPGMYQTKIMG